MLFFTKYFLVTGDLNFSVFFKNLPSYLLFSTKSGQKMHKIYMLDPFLTFVEIRDVTKTLYIRFLTKNKYCGISSDLSG